MCSIVNTQTKTYSLIILSELCTVHTYMCSTAIQPAGRGVFTRTSSLSGVLSKVLHEQQALSELIMQYSFHVCNGSNNKHGHLFLEDSIKRGNAQFINH